MKATYKIDKKCVLIRDVYIWDKVCKPGTVVTVLDAYYEKNMIVMGLKTKKGVYEVGFGPISHAMKTRKNLMDEIFEKVVFPYYPNGDIITIYRIEGGQTKEIVINVMHETDEYPQPTSQLN